MCFLKLIFKEKVKSMIIRSDILEHLMKTKKLSKISNNFTVIEKDSMAKIKIIHINLFEVAHFLF